MDIKEAGEDIISSLPDCLLIHILSLLGNTKQAVKTCVLSKRWKFVWTHLLEVELKESMFANDLEPVEIMKYADRMISKCNNLNRLAIVLHYDRAYVSDVNNLMNNIVNKNKVKDFTLSLESDADIEDDQNKYHLPQDLFSYSSLSKLSLSFCAIDPPLGIIEWKSLESLAIEYVELLDTVMENILSNCPLLKILNLSNCRGLSKLNINSPNLTTLYYGSENEEADIVSPELFVSAPHLLHLSIFRESGGKKYFLQNVSSVVEARVEFDSSSDNTSDSNNDNMIKLLESLCSSVETLSLGTTVLQIASELELELLKFPSFPNLWSLTVDVDREEKHIPGILAMLRPSPNLTTLHIQGCGITNMEVDTPLPKLYMGKNSYLYEGCHIPPVKSHLKTVVIHNNIDTDHMMHLVRILLKCAIVLEEMVINLDAPSSKAEINSMKKISKKLHSFPRASPKAVLELCYY